MARFGVSRGRKSPVRTRERERTESSRTAGTRKASAATKSWRTNGSSSPSSGSVAHSRLTKISAIAQSYRQSSAWPIRLDRYQALLAATHDRGQPQRHTLRDRPRGGGCDTLYLKLRPRNAVLGRVLIIATARRSLSDVAFARKWTNSRRLGRSDLCRLGKHKRRPTR